MGSKSDWEVMSAACETLEQFGVPYEKKVISAHRTPQFFSEYMATARDRGVGIVIAGAGGAGFMIFYVKPEKQEAVRTSLSHLREMDFEMDNSGATIVMTDKDFI